MTFLGIGSNLSSSFGDRIKNINLAILHLQNEGIKIIKKSGYYETPSYPKKTNPKFINIVLKIKTNISLEKMASIILLVEEKLERTRDNKNDPRTCDIDIIDYNKKVTNFMYKNLNFLVPHKNLSYRNFVLIPLMEISPNWIHPKTNVPVAHLIENLSIEDKNSILKVEES